MLAHRHNKKTGNEEYCLVSTKDPSKILEWYGSKRPSDTRLAKSERRVEYFKHQK